MSILITKIIAGLSAVLVVIAGFLGLASKSQIIDLQDRINQLEQGIEERFGAYYPVAGGVYTLKGSGIGTTDTSITLVSFKQPVSEIELTMADFGSIGYATIDPGTSKKEFISFTGITQATTSDQAILTGVSRGLQFTHPYTASSSLAQSHSGGAKLIISNPPQHYEQYANLSRNQTITGDWTFSATNTPQYNATPTFLGDTLEFATINYVLGVATSGAANAYFGTTGLIELATTSQLIAGTATGSTGAYLVAPNLFFNQTSSAANLVPVTKSNGDIDIGFMPLNVGWTFTGNVTSTGLTSLATTTFTVIPTLPASNPTSDNQAVRKAYVDAGDAAIQNKVRVYASSSNQAIENASNTKVIFDQESFDLFGEFTTTTSRFIATTTGYYLVIAQVKWAATTTDAKNYNLYLVKNCTSTSNLGEDIIIYKAYVSSGTTEQSVNFADIISLTAGDWLEVYVYQDSGTTQTITAGSNHTYFSVARLK